VPSTDRPYFRHSTSQIRELFQAQHDDAILLSALAVELQYRDRPAAIALRSSIERRLVELNANSRASPMQLPLETFPRATEGLVSQKVGVPPSPQPSRTTRDPNLVTRDSLLNSTVTPVHGPALSEPPVAQQELSKGTYLQETDQSTVSPRNLLRRLFEYIGEQLKDVDPRGYHLSRLDFRCQPADVAGLPGVELDLRLEGDHIWLRVARLEADTPPKAPAECRDILRVAVDPFGSPPCLDETALSRELAAVCQGKEGAERKQLETRLRTSVAAALTNYSKLWKAWAEGEKPRRKTIALYSELFSRKYQMEAEQTAKPTELVWGVGIAVWLMSYEGKSFSFQYPLLTQTVEITIDEQNMSLDIRPRATGARVEMDAFVACMVNGSADVEIAARAHLDKHKDRAPTPFDPGSYADVLKLIAANLDSRGSYHEILRKGSPVPDAQEHLVVTDSWALFVRPRNNNYLVEDLKRLQGKLASGCSIPDGPLALVSPPSDEPIEFEPVNFRGLSSRGSHGGGRIPDELYFPQPYNEEQITIIQRLERTAGVTVQGPPGTGKTHTIANIICHYLATGRRVLVSSRGEPALEVLQSKIPEEVRPLTVALLASDREGIRQFQASIEAIQHRVSQLDPHQTRVEIDTIKTAIDRAHSEIASIDRRVDEIAMTQLAEIEVDGKPMRAQKLAELVVSGRTQHSWFDDNLSLSPEYAPPLSGEEGALLRECRRKLGPDLVYVCASTPSVDALPAASTITELHNALGRMQELDEDEQSGKLLALKATTRQVLQSARTLLEQVENALPLVKQLESCDGAWPLELRAKCRRSSFASEREALEALLGDLTSLVEARATFLKQPVEFPDSGLTSAKTREAVARAAETGKPFGFFVLGAADARAHLAGVKIAGLPPKDTADWSHVQAYLLLHNKVSSFLARWNQLSDVLGIPKLEGGVSSLRTIEQTALAARNACSLAIEFDITSLKHAESVFVHPPTKELLGSSADLEAVRIHLLRHLTRDELSRAATNFSALQDKLAGRTGPVSEAFRQFIKSNLGNKALDSSHVARRFIELTGELRRIAGLSSELSMVRDLAMRLENAGASHLATRVRSECVPQSGEDEVFPVSWREAWTWARVRSHLDAIEARDDLLTMAARRRDLEAGLARLYRDMVAKAAWLATKRNATPRVLQALAGYATAIRRIGQGTGPNAVRYRRDARECMEHAAGAVPCWIMSHAKVSESMPPEIGAFDLVIVDEASQSDLWALPAIVRGKKILVVGDDKQVSPDGGFIAGQRIEELKHRFLSDQPYGVEMTPEKSLYDLAARVFAAQQVMLREHFRCVSAIIAYSNRTFYKGAIYPLRIPKASERIDPPLVDMFVEGGLRDRHDCNDQEAEAIAGEISAILKNERFPQRTIGVVSLLGMEQAKRIDAAVRGCCPAGELLRRKFECGDARTFQGSERDIMFLSMVVDRDNCKALSGNMFEQRFNVAASRARDRMYLVRSIRASDLSEKDLRLTLLNHFDGPQQSGDSDEENLIALCESGFERELFSKLMNHGYRVVPQVRNGVYRIDMVVEGAGDTRLAIECDGDEYHGPDRWQHDTNRQRVLERVGWTFWRCFASTWSLRKDEVFGELTDQLTAMGIEPLGALERVPTLVEKRIWVPAKLASSNDDVQAAIDSPIGEQQPFIA